MYYIKIPFLDLDKTFSANICTGWTKVRDGKYCIIDGENFVTVEQGHSEMFGFGCSEDDFYNHWYDYFNLNVDYVRQNYIIRHLGKSLKRAAVRGAGIRIPQQNFIQTLVREVFNDRFSDADSISYEALFRYAIGKRHRNTVRGSGPFTWYSLPLDNKDLLGGYSRIVEVFKGIATKQNKHDIIWSLKIIKSVLLDLEWYDFCNMETEEITDVFVGYGLSLSAAQYICIKCFGRQDIFVINEITDKAVANIDDWDEYENAEDFAEWILIDEKSEISAYLNEIIRWDMEHPPKPGDELLWA